MRFISLFAGIGGFDLGLERAGMTCVAQVENDPFCQRVLAKHWPDVPRFKDVREFGKHNAPPADLICGGAPCQPHSVAGKRQGATDDRDLWPEYHRIVRECLPRWVIAENVPGIRTTILDQVLSDLESLDYQTGTLVIPACAFDAPHPRERVFVIAHAKGGERGISVPARNKEKSVHPGGTGQIWTTSNPHHNQVLCNEQHNETNTNPTWTGPSGNAPNANGNGRGQMEQPDSRRTQGKRTVGPLATRLESWWEAESGICGVDDGFPMWLDRDIEPVDNSPVPNRAARIRALGNTVMPQITEFLARGILQVNAQYKR